MKKPHSRLSAVLVAALALSLCAQAQRMRPGLPPSRDSVLGRRLRGRVPMRRAPDVDEAGLRAEDRLRPKDEPLRYGAVLSIDITLEDGLWEDLPDGGRVWRQKLTSPGALSLGLVFRRFQLPVGAELFVYGAAGTEALGAFTHENHRPDGGFAVQPVQGDELTLEYHEPEGLDSRGDIRLAALVHDYRGVIELAQKNGQEAKAAACEIDVRCPWGAGWEDPAKSVLRILAGGFLCSGALLNNTADDGAQLFLTAEHCGDLSSAVFTFNYERPACGTGNPPANQTVQGSVALVRSSLYDVQLVRITETIPDSYQAFLAGWDRSGSTPSSTVAIHHPRGLPKKISFDNDSPLRSGTQWRISEWDLGVTEPGSSGSPLFDSGGRVIGQLCCGLADCGFPFDDFYGRFAAEWSLLAPHLDPGGVGTTAIDGAPLIPSQVELLAVEEVQPSVLEALRPGTSQDVTLQGSGFGPAASILVDGVPLATESYAIQDSRTITIDMPQVVFLGRHMLTVFQNGEIASIFFDVIAATGPGLQAGSGDPLTKNLVASSEGLTLIGAGPVGQLQFVLFSGSDRPSQLSFVSLCLGNGFLELELATVLTMSAAGWTRADLPLPPIDLELSLQSVSLDSGLPIPTSNCQQVHILPL